jgi:uncharacterized protein YyaL (SSP411 family)
LARPRAVLYEPEYFVKNTHPMVIAFGLAVAMSAILAARANQPAVSLGDHTNRLISEKSPYLQLHAHNPVDWYPWGNEAFEKARRENKPIFLSIGYSTCHWCHVMEAETFSDPAMAEVMNRTVVSIKVDREERPDIDRVYMSYVLNTTGGGGWPMTVFLTPDLKPFFGATYLPPDDRNGKPGFRTLLGRVGTQWATNRAQILEAAKSGTQLIEAQSGTGSTGASKGLDVRVFDRTYQDLRSSYDSAEGGFGPAPKFPRPVLINFLFRYNARAAAKPALDMSLQTLRAMARGGIRDHLGGGFHRYATDREWRVPHFEKMLYDQAQLAIAYTEAYQITKDQAFADVAREILEYVLRDMRGEDGGFYSAEDADSAPAAGARPTEGAFYVWTADQLNAALGDETARVFAFHYGIEPAGNVPARQDVQGELKSQNILTVRHTVAETAARFGKAESDVVSLLTSARRKLADSRAARPRPPRDDKVIVAWNGMMLSAFARAAQVFDERRYLDAARASATFVETRMYDATAKTLKRRYRQGEAEIDALVEDYVFLTQGLLDLYEASFEVKWLAWAVSLQDQQDQLFWDSKNGAYFSTRAGASNILVRMKDDYDGAEPSPNSVAALNLLRLWQMTDRREWQDKATKTFAAQSRQLTQPGLLVPQLASALDFSFAKHKQIVIAGEPGAADTRAMLKLVHDRFIPNKILLLVDGGPSQAALAKWLPFVANMDRREGKATAYICENYACNLPTADLPTAARLLDSK